MDNIKDLRLAVLIDAENVPYANVKEMLEEISKYGIPTFKRIYADWTHPGITGWKKVLLENAITPIQQYSYTKGKNASDSAMIIDAMDILYSGKADGFCIISSDSDFTRLATRLREAGMMVIGMGEKKTPESFISACEKFIYLEILTKEQEKSSSSRYSKYKTKHKHEANKAEDKLDIVKDTILDIADESGWVFLGELGNMLLKKKPDFDPRNYGFSKMLPLIKSLENIEIEERESGKSRTKAIYVRVKSSDRNI